MRPFKIHLLGSAIDLVTIGFKGMKVTSRDFGKPEFTVDIGDVEIGSALSFVQALGPFFGPKPDDGPYVRLSLSPLGVLAGYKFSAPVIPVGGLLFSGIAISIEMILPFENQQATFAFAFASRRRPFLVSAPPYGGGGFVGLLATPRGAIGFEIQIEFGAVVPIEFGPLRAEGRVTAGIYLRSRPGSRILEGFVRAVGEGNIACFSICVCIEVTIRQENGGRMTGSSSFSFTFKVGFVKVSYGFTATYAVQGGGSGTERAQARNRLAARNSAQANVIYCSLPPNLEPGRSYESRLTNRRTNWGAYKKNFAI